MDTRSEGTMRSVRDHRVDPFAAYNPLRVRFARGELILQTGSYAAGVYLATSGLVLESFRDPMTAAADPVCAVCVPGDLLGLEILLPAGGERYLACCRAVTDVCLSFLERHDFAAALDQDSTLRAFVRGALVARRFAALRALSRRRAPDNERLRALLLELAAGCGEPDGEDGRVLLRAIDRQLVAELAGMSPRRLKKAWTAMAGVETEAVGLRLAPALLRQSSVEG